MPMPLFPRAVLLLSLASFFNDVASELLLKGALPLLADWLAAQGWDPVPIQRLAEPAAGGSADVAGLAIGESDAHDAPDPRQRVPQRLLEENVGARFQQRNHLVVDVRQA